jgi:hypothetical protein
LYNSSFIFCVVIFNSYIFFYSVLCFNLVFVEVLSEFIYLFLCLLIFFIVSWNFLSASCTLCLTMSRVFSMNFSVISSKISSLRVLCGCHWAP